MRFNCNIYSMWFNNTNICFVNFNYLSLSKFTLSTIHCACDFYSFFKTFIFPQFFIRKFHIFTPFFIKTKNRENSLFYTVYLCFNSKSWNDFTFGRE